MMCIAGLLIPALDSAILKCALHIPGCHFSFHRCMWNLGAKASGVVGFNLSFSFSTRYGL